MTPPAPSGSVTRRLAALAHVYIRSEVIDETPALTVWLQCAQVAVVWNPGGSDQVLDAKRIASRVADAIAEERAAIGDGVICRCDGERTGICRGGGRLFTARRVGGNPPL